MSNEYEKINLATHAARKFFNDEISEKDFKTIIDECSKGSIGIVKQKFDEMYKNTLRDKECRNHLIEKSVLTVEEMAQCEID
jgi:hypothetical protein